MMFTNLITKKQLRSFETQSISWNSNVQNSFSFPSRDRQRFTHQQTQEKVWFSIMQNYTFLNSVFLIHRNIIKKTNISEIFELHYYNYLNRLMCIGYQSKNTTTYIFNIQMRTNYMFRPCLVGPSSGWNTKNCQRNYITIQYDRQH
jgi:hypothetical protein